MEAFHSSHKISVPEEERKIKEFPYFPQKIQSRMNGGQGGKNRSGGFVG